MYFPLIVHEALMLEPTETESRETLDQAAKAMLEILEQAHKDPEALKQAPITAPVREAGRGQGRAHPDSQVHARIMREKDRSFPTKAQMEIYMWEILC